MKGCVFFEFSCIITYYIVYHIVYYVFGPECDPPLYVAKNITIHQGVVLRNRSILKGHKFKIVLYYIIYYIVYYIVYYIIYCIIYHISFYSGRHSVTQCLRAGSLAKTQRYAKLPGRKSRKTQRYARPPGRKSSQNTALRKASGPEV